MSKCEMIVIQSTVGSSNNHCHNTLHYYNADASNSSSAGLARCVGEQDITNSPSRC